MAAKNGKLTAKQESAALLLAVGRSIKAAALGAGTAERTLRYWLESEDFKARVQALRSRVFDRTVGKLCGASVGAARTLRTLLKSADPKIKLAAARIILEAAPRLREMADLAVQVDDLRRLLEEVQHGLGGPARPGPENGGGAGGAGLGADAGPDPTTPRPGLAHDGLGDAGRPVAEQPATVPFPEDATALFPAER